MRATNAYILITPARNEGRYIERTIQSVIRQTIRPVKWVIVSDGSTDDTDEIVSRYARKHDFIKLVRRNGADDNRNFGSKVRSIEQGMLEMGGVDYAYYGNLDADMSLEKDYYENILRKFESDDHLGVAGGEVYEKYGDRWRRMVASPWSVGGMIQMFRRECYEEIGGYRALPKGGVDAIAETMARKAGWKVRSFGDVPVYHNRNMGTEKGHVLKSRFRQGIMEFTHGNHPLFEMAKCLLRLKEKPVIFGSLFRFAGFVWASLKREKRAVPEDVVEYLRKEQLRRLHIKTVFSNSE